MVKHLDLTKHESYIHTLITSWKVDEQDREDYYQDFFIYFTMYAKYDPSKGKPTTFIKAVFKNFMLSKNMVRGKDATHKDAIHIEDRDEEYLDRELGCSMTEMENEYYLNQLLKDADDVTVSIIVGDVTRSEQSRKEGVSRQAVNERHARALRKIIGE